VVSRARAVGQLTQFATLCQPGVVHAITTREAGSLSLADGDDPAEVRRRRRAVAEALEIEPRQLVCAQQVHGAMVRRVGAAERERGAWSRDDAIPAADALVTDEPGLFPMLLFADCVPILLVDRRRRAVGLAHAGWQGTARAIAARTVEAMRAHLGCDPADLDAAIGPAIGGCCYEVSDEVATAVLAATPSQPGEVVRPGARGRPHLDLAAANRAQLVAAGLGPANVEVSAECTSCRVDRFFSHRAERGRTGRHAAILGLL
jgi:purine-nucleoside/S-methyl-5'-thioadenosine phosphorylase / adenosine deaminase